MIKVSTEISGTEFSGTNAKRAIRVSEDFALKLHRRKFMPLHFKAVARLRYPGEYRKTAGNYSRSGSSRKDGQGRRNTNRERRMARGVGQSTEERPSVSQVKRPIFDSGLTQLKVLKGGFKVTGRFDSRGVTYNVPFYIKINPAGQINKVKALSAISNQEEKKLGEVTEKKFVKELDKKKTKKKW